MNEKSQSHPDLDALSATLDAGSDVDVDAHVAQCEACRSVVARLRGARAAVGSPPPAPSKEARERAIAAALGAADWLHEPKAPAAPNVGAPAAPNVGAPAAPKVIVPIRSRSRWWVPVSGVAAALLLVVGAVALLNRGGETSTGTALSAGPASESQASESQAADSKTAAATTGDLGDVADLNALRARLRNVATAAPLARTDVAAPSAVASGASANSFSASAAAVPAQVGTRVCEEQARTARPTLGVVVYAANLTYAGTPAVALGFATKASDPPATLLVLAPGQGCRLLAETSLP